MNTEKVIDSGVWVVEKSTALSSLTVAEGASLAAPEGKSLTMTVYGIGMPIKPGSYKGDIFLTVADSFSIPPGPESMWRDRAKPKKFRTAILIEDGKYVPEKSIPALVQGGKVNDRITAGITIASGEEGLNGIIVRGSGEYTIEGAKIYFEGNRGNDLIGYGSGIACFDNTRLTINNSDIHLMGITRSAFHAGGNSVATLNNCRISNNSPFIDKMNPTWQLGFRGTNRATMCVDNATVYYNNCHITSNGWGVCSIDAGKTNRMYFKDCTLELTGWRARGYGAFSIGDCLVSYDHCTLNIQGYPLLICGHNIIKSDGVITGGSVINSTLYGVLVLRGNKSELKVDRGSVFNTASSVFVVKGSNSYINIDNAELNPGNGVILQLMDSDDIGMGADRFIPPIGEVDTAIPGRDLTAADPKEDVFMTVSNMEVRGDFYNSTTNLKANCRVNRSKGETAGWPEMGDIMEPLEMKETSIPHGPPPSPPEGTDAPMDPRAKQGVKNLDIKFTNVRVNGIISAAAQAYKDGVTVIDVRNLEELGNVTQTPHEPVNNGVIVAFDAHCVWTVAGTSYLTKLTIAQGAVIKAPEGRTLTMTIDGVQKEIAPGNYAGKIVLAVTG